MKLSECFEQTSSNVYRVKSNVPIKFHRFFELPEKVVNFEIVFFDCQHFGIFRTETETERLETDLKTCDFCETVCRLRGKHKVSIFRFFGKLCLRSKQLDNVLFEDIDLLS